MNPIECFKANCERPDLIMEFNSQKCKVYMNESYDKELVIGPKEASCLVIYYTDFKGNHHTIEGITSMFVSDYVGKK